MIESRESILLKNFLEKINENGEYHESVIQKKVSSTKVQIIDEDENKDDEKSAEDYNFQNDNTFANDLHNQLSSSKIKVQWIQFIESWKKSSKIKSNKQVMMIVFQLISRKMDEEFEVKWRELQGEMIKSWYNQNWEKK